MLPWFWVSSHPPWSTTLPPSIGPCSIAFPASAVAPSLSVLFITNYVFQTYSLFLPLITLFILQVQIEELESILREVKSKSHDDIKTLAGGSVANTIRGLSRGFGISTGIIGAYGDDHQGQLFLTNMTFNSVDLSRLRQKKGHTAQVPAHNVCNSFYHIIVWHNKLMDLLCVLVCLLGRWHG